VAATFLASAQDPTAYALVPPLLLAVTLFAALIPALRASRIDPMKALRDE
jgi:ABC-type lipoprotein release transport system permease subunit